MGGGNVQGSGPQPPLRPAIRNTMVGCLTMFVGFFGGGMIAVLMGKGVDMATRCAPGEGLPACNWHIYWLVGGLLGAIFLPAVVLIKLLRGDAAAADSGQ